MSTSNKKNRGTGAGGANTNAFGLRFEVKTCNQRNLTDNGFQKKELGTGVSTYYLVYNFDDLQVVVYYASKKGFVKLIKQLFDVETFREPDEAYIIHYLCDNTYHIKILEKKNQNTAGSVEDKLLTGNTIRKIYQRLLPSYCNVSYAFCVSTFLKNNINSNSLKYKVLREIFEEDNIPIFFGDDDDYFCKINHWIGL
mgnify:CR=1 FL=1